jgi:hypothetical protein
MATAASGFAVKRKLAAWISRKRQRPELEEIVKQRIGAGDFRVTIHRDPDTDWHATIYGRQPAEVHRCQILADTIAAELCRHYQLDE